MSRRMLATILFVVIACLGLAATCNVERRILSKAEDLQEDLCKMADEFNRMIAWRYFDEASVLVVPEKRADFLMHTDQVYARANMEGYKVSLCQVSPQPFPRVRGVVQPTPRSETETPTPEPTPKPEPDDVSPTPKPRMPENWFGMVLVRYVNLTIAPSNKVSSPMLRQYWYLRGETWFVDPDLDQLFELDNPQPEQPAAPRPVVPAP